MNFQTQNQDAADESQKPADTFKESSSDSDEDFAKLSKKLDAKFHKKMMKKMKKIVFSDSESGSDHAESKAVTSGSEPEAEEESGSTSKRLVFSQLRSVFFYWYLQ